ncbi:hypothetical protein [uncultured Mucilaginibacter sp.]|uniref:hypothetical protein n=1 Tax=uncultured Mucilaginibacter sp. TaxID=797541 RepID=UPI0025F35B6B|nr:hypothetical protein [uncultured Mucilaginibacter sp.]
MMIEEYFKLVYNYYPKNLFVSDLGYPYTEEMARYFKLESRAKENNGSFKKTIESLSLEFNCLVMDNSFCGAFDLSYRAIFYIPKNLNITRFTRCVINIGVLAKYYCVYLTQAYANGKNTFYDRTVNENEQGFVNKVSLIIQENFPDYRPFPIEKSNVKIPNIYSAKRPGEFATLFECLMTDYIL